VSFAFAAFASTSIHIMSTISFNLSVIANCIGVNPSPIAHIQFVQAVRVHKFIVSQPISSSLFYG